jgi:hypothetical protein
MSHVQVNVESTGTGQGGSSPQVQAQMQLQLNELLGLVLSMNNRMMKQVNDAMALCLTTGFLRLLVRFVFDRYSVYIEPISLCDGALSLSLKFEW